MLLTDNLETGFISDIYEKLVPCFRSTAKGPMLYSRDVKVAQIYNFGLSVNASFETKDKR